MLSVQNGAGIVIPSAFPFQMQDGGGHNVFSLNAGSGTNGTFLLGDTNIPDAFASAIFNIGSTGTFNLKFGGSANGYYTWNFGGLTAQNNGSPSKVFDNHGNLFMNPASAPINSSDPGLAGQFTFDAGNLYICVADNMWKKIVLSAF